MKIKNNNITPTVLYCICRCSAAGGCIIIIFRDHLSRRRTGLERARDRRVVPPLLPLPSTISSRPLAIHSHSLGVSRRVRCVSSRERRGASSRQRDTSFRPITVPFVPNIKLIIVSLYSYRLIIFHRLSSPSPGHSEPRRFVVYTRVFLREIPPYVAFPAPIPRARHVSTELPSPTPPPPIRGFTHATCGIPRAIHWTTAVRFRCRVRSLTRR